MGATLSLVLRLHVHVVRLLWRAQCPAANHYRRAWRHSRCCRGTPGLQVPSLSVKILPPRIGEQELAACPLTFAACVLHSEFRATGRTKN